MKVSDIWFWLIHFLAAVFVIFEWVRLRVILKANEIILLLVFDDAPSHASILLKANIVVSKKWLLLCAVDHRWWDIYYLSCVQDVEIHIWYLLLVFVLSHSHKLHFNVSSLLPSSVSCNLQLRFSSFLVSSCCIWFAGRNFEAFPRPHTWPHDS